MKKSKYFILRIEKNLFYGIIQKAIGLLIVLFCLTISILSMETWTFLFMGLLSLYGFYMMAATHRIKFMV